MFESELELAYRAMDGASSPARLLQNKDSGVILQLSDPLAEGQQSRVALRRAPSRGTPCFGLVGAGARVHAAMRWAEPSNILSLRPLLCPLSTVTAEPQQQQTPTARLKGSTRLPIKPRLPPLVCVHVDGAEHRESGCRCCHDTVQLLSYRMHCSQ